MKSASGQVIVGGRSHHDTEIFSSIELFPRPPSETCQIPNNPPAQLKRESHSLSLILGDVFVICGGSDGSKDLDSCISWSAGKASWTHLYTMRYLCMMIYYAAFNHFKQNTIRYGGSTATVTVYTYLLKNHFDLQSSKLSLRKPRLGHTAWTPSPLPLPDLMIVFGGRSNMTEFDAEILPGKEGVHFIVLETLSGSVA